MSRTNETRHNKWHETRKSKCRLDESVIWNNIWISINGDGNARNWLAKEYVIKYLL